MFNLLVSRSICTILWKTEGQMAFLRSIQLCVPWLYDSLHDLSSPSLKTLQVWWPAQIETFTLYPQLQKHFLLSIWSVTSNKIWGDKSGIIFISTSSFISTNISDNKLCHGANHSNPQLYDILSMKLLAFSLTANFECKAYFFTHTLKLQSL